MITFMNNQEKQIQQLKNQLRNTHSTFMDLADIFISRVKEKIVEESKPKKIEKVFELSNPFEPPCRREEEVPFSKPYMTSLSKFFKPTHEREGSKFHKIFVGSVLVTPYSFPKVTKRSFGFKPGTHQAPSKENPFSNFSRKQPHHTFVTRQKVEYGTTRTLIDPTLRHITPCESNKTFDPGGMC